LKVGDYPPLNDFDEELDEIWIFVIVLSSYAFIQNR
jgi:hypothetical protein